MYYVGKKGEESGPFTMEQLRSMVGKDELHVDDLVWAEGMPQWRQAGTVPGLFASATVPLPPDGISPPGAQAEHGYPPPTFLEVPNYLWQSVLVTLLCFPFFGIPAIMSSVQVNNKMAVGDVSGAQAASSRARRLCWLSLIVGAVVYAVSLAYTWKVLQESGELSF